MIKRSFDVLLSTIGLLVMSPVLLIACFLVWFQDRYSPFYIAPRACRSGGSFNLVKIRSMVISADISGVTSTSLSDTRITKVGHIIRRYKIDELTQLWNVLKGDMSIVGPRPQVHSAVCTYTDTERRLLSVRPGITDFASIVFADEGDILKDHADADIAYNQLIRPGKNALGLFYIDNATLWVDIRLCFLTAATMVSRNSALAGVQKILRKLGATPEMLELAGRRQPLRPMLPPGASEIVTSRD